MWERGRCIGRKGKVGQRGYRVIAVEEEGRERDLKGLDHPIEFKYWDKNIYSEA
jgi:hypothetical protein